MWAAGRERHRLCDARDRDRTVPRQAVADPAARGGARSCPRPFAASSHTMTSRPTTRCRSCSMFAVICTGVVIVLSGLSIWKPGPVPGGPPPCSAATTSRVTCISSRWRDRRVPGPARYARADRPENAAAMIAVAELKRRIPMPRIRKVIPRRRSQIAGQGRRQGLLPEPSRPALPARRRRPRRHHDAHRLHLVDSNSAEGALAKISRFNDRVQALLFNPNKLAPTYTGQHDHQAVPVQRLLRRGRCARSRRRDVQARGRRPCRRQDIVDVCKTSTRCRRTSRSPATSASRAGARSARGRVRGWRTFSSASAPTRAPSTSGSSAPKAIPTRSTCRPRCIRRRR